MGKSIDGPPVRSNSRVKNETGIFFLPQGTIGRSFLIIYEGVTKVRLIIHGLQITPSKGMRLHTGLGMYEKC